MNTYKCPNEDDIIKAVCCEGFIGGRGYNHDVRYAKRIMGLCSSALDMELSLCTVYAMPSVHYTFMETYNLMGSVL